VVVDLSGILQTVDQRARSVRGARLAAQALFATSLATLAVLTGVWLAGGHLSAGVSATLLAGSLSSATVGFFLGRRQRCDLPRLLLRVDLAAGTEERLAALYELRLRGGAPTYRSRIEAALGDLTVNARQALPLARSSVLLLSLGAAAIALSVGMSMLPSRSARDDVVRVAAETQAPAPTAQPALEPGPKLPRSTDADAVRADVGPSSDVLERTVSTPELDGALSMASGQTVLSADGEDLDELLAAQAALLSQLSEQLDGLGDTVEELSAEDAAALQELASQLPGSPLRDAVEELTEAADPDAVQEALDNLRDMLSEESAPASSGSSEGDADRETQVPGESPWEPPEPEPDSLSPGDAARASGQGPDDADDQRSRTDSRPGSAGESPGVERMLGGEESREAESVVHLERREPAFYDVAIEGQIGLEGEFEEFVTRGVPLETAAGSTEAHQVLTVDYDALRAVLEQRSVAPEDRETVRRYFEAITQGGT